MTFSKINGWTVLAAHKTPPTQKLAPHGELGRRFDGRPVRHRKSIENSFTLATTKMDEVCADTLEGLLEGRNHHFAFIHDVWSESGLGPQQGNTWTLMNTGGPVATRGHYVDVGAGTLAFNPEFIDDPVAPDGGRWGVLYWFLNGTTWERRMLRSDGSKFVDGALAPAVTFGEITVAVGGVVFANTSEIADLNLFSFYPCDEYAQQEFDWVSGFNMAWRMRFDGSFVDELAEHVGTASGTPLFLKSPLGQAVGMDGSTDFVTMPDVALSNIDGLSAVTLQAWVRRGVPLAATEQVFDNRVTASTKLTLEMSSTDLVTARAASASGDAHNLSATVALTQDVWHLLTFVVDLVADTMVIYDGATVIASDTAVGFTATTFSGGVVASGVIIGRRSSTATQYWSGDLDEVRLFHRALTALQVAEIYACESDRTPFPGPRLSSSLPRLDLWGDVIGCREPVEVLGVVTGESYVQHGAPAGWVNNAREIALTLDVVKSRPGQDRIPTPDVGWLFQSKMIANPQTSTVLASPIASGYLPGGTGFGFDNRGKTGPFNYPDGAFTFNGDYAFSNAADFGEILYGAQGCTVLAWAKTPTPATAQVLFEMWLNNTPDVRLRLDTLASRPRLSARSEAADTLWSGNGTTVLVANEWALIGGTVDLLADEINTHVDGIEVSSDSRAFGATRFSDEAKTTTPYMRIGVNAAAGAPWLGDIAGLYIWRRKLTPGEIFSVYELGKRGVFS